MQFDRVIKGDVVLPEGVMERGYVAIRGEVIAAIGQGALPPTAEVAEVPVAEVEGDAVEQPLSLHAALREALCERLSVLPGATTCCGCARRLLGLGARAPLFYCTAKLFSLRRLV